MRFRLLPTLTNTIGIGLLFLVTASSADAAWGPRHTAAGALCEAQPGAALRKLLRHPKSYGGPLATRPRLSHLGLRVDLTPRFQRAKRSHRGDDDAAIQNDAPAARVDAGDSAVSALRPIGFLIGYVDSHHRTRAFSPRSPRGPPPGV